MKTDACMCVATPLSRPVVSEVDDGPAGRSFTVRLEAGQELPTHRNPARVVITAVRGCGAITIGELETRELCEGAFVQLEPNASHSRRGRRRRTGAVRRSDAQLLRRLLMDRYVVHFLRASLVWLGAGVSLGVAMAVHPAWVIYRTAHLHMLLLGFVTMMIAGVAYHVLPRFAATPLYSRRVAAVHFVVANIGVALLASGFIVRFHSTAIATPMLAVGGGLSAIGAYALAWNLWRTLDGAAVPLSQLATIASARPAPTPPVSGRAAAAPR